MRQIYLSLLLFSVLVSLAALPAAQLGEQAGQPSLNVPLGGTATFNYSILNAGASPINFTVILPTLNTIPHNTTPTVVVTPMNGSLAPYSKQTVTIKVSMPGNDRTNLTWQGVLQVVEQAPQTVSSSGASATINAGVAKILTIHSVAPSGLPLVYFLMLFGAVVVVVAVASYFLFVRKKKVAKTAAAKRAAEARAMKVAVRRRPGRPRGARKAPARRRPGRPSAGARKHTAARARDRRSPQRSSSRARRRR